MPLRDPTKENPLSASRNLFPSFPLDDNRSREAVSDGGIRAYIDIDEPIEMYRGTTKDVEFRYRSGVPQATSFGITWHASKTDADAVRDILQDMYLPHWSIEPQTPKKDTGNLQIGTVTLVAPDTMALGVVWGAIAIYQP